ncbi:MAG: ABC transporter permease [Planctomycetaceae bacterium]|nr:ABC transporter permease [Planctomycetaceae bacterium]
MLAAWCDALKLGVKSLLLHKLRAGLAALGIFIGTTAVIWLVAIGEGVSFQAQQQIADLGATNIILRSVVPRNRIVDPENERVKRYGLLRADYERMLTNVPTVVQAVPMRELKRDLRVGDRVSSAVLVGCTDDYRLLNHLSMARGRAFNSRDEEQNVVILADGTASQLFPFQDPIGKSVSIDNDVYTVIGQTAARTASAAVGGSMQSREYNSDAYIPLSTLQLRIGDFVMQRKPGNYTGEVVELSQITLTVRDIADVDVTARIVESLLDKYHEQDDYAVVVPVELLRQAERTRALFNALLVVIAGISLVVGGIGIMNIMLATVTERTREIGIRRAMGATRSKIVQQFIMESIVLTSLGGCLGALCGLLCGPLFRLVRRLLAALSPESVPEILESLEPRIAPWSVVLALVIAIGVGLLFGVYPARQASRLDPIEALRHE